MYPSCKLSKAGVGDLLGVTFWQPGVVGQHENRMNAKQVCIKHAFHVSDVPSTDPPQHVHTPHIQSTTSPTH